MGVLDRNHRNGQNGLFGHFAISVISGFFAHPGHQFWGPLASLAHNGKPNNAECIWSRARLVAKLVHAAGHVVVASGVGGRHGVSNGMGAHRDVCTMSGFPGVLNRVKKEVKKTSFFRDFYGQNLPIFTPTDPPTFKNGQK